MSRAETMRRRWQEPAFRDRVVGAQRAAAAEPENRERLAAQARANSVAVAASEDSKAKMSAALRRRWADPVQRSKMLAASARGCATNAQRASERRAVNPDDARGRNPWLSRQDREMIAAAVAAGERRIMVAADWLITESRVGQIVRDANL
jgi:hypothetical protein